MAECREAAGGVCLRRGLPTSGGFFLPNPPLKGVTAERRSGDVIPYQTGATCPPPADSALNLPVFLFLFLHHCLSPSLVFSNTFGPSQPRHWGSPTNETAPFSPSILSILSILVNWSSAFFRLLPCRSVVKTPVSVAAPPPTFACFCAFVFLCFCGHHPCPRIHPIL